MAQNQCETVLRSVDGGSDLNQLRGGRPDGAQENRLGQIEIQAGMPSCEGL